MITLTFIIKEDNMIQPVEFCPTTKDFERIPTSAFLTVDEMADDIIHRMSRDTMVDLVEDFKTGKLITWHMNLGMYIRNTYGLWLEQHPLIQRDHPDDTSYWVMELFCRKHLDDAKADIAFKDAKAAIDD